MAIKLGSLFDGSGGFPLAGSINGIVPAWASEVEPYPLRVTEVRFPNMKHLGSVTDIDGASVEPVDVITFGSPCQDLSIAGKQKGIHDGDRSNLFFEAVRIIKEMRSKDEANGWTDVDVRPRFAVWENVPGAFSSNKGRDFQAVLQSLAEVKDSAVHVPGPEKGKWKPAGYIVGDGWSIAWRVYDAQYWGVPQRRKRIYLVADFASERAGQILFECESLRGDSPQSGSPWKGVASDSQRCSAPYDRDGKLYEDVEIEVAARKYEVDNDRLSDLLRSHKGTWTNRAIAEKLGKPETEVAHWFRNDKCFSVPDPAVWYELKEMLGIETNEFDAAVTEFEYKGGSYDMRNRIHTGDVAPTLTCGSGNNLHLLPESKTYDARGNGDGEKTNTRIGDHESRITDYSSVVIEPVVAYTMQAFGDYKCCGVSSGLKARDFKDATDLVCCVDCRNLRETPEIYQTLQAKSGGGHSLNYSGAVRVKHVVRRLTPTECARLQGFPDDWGDVSEKKSFTCEEYSFWLKVRNTHAAINGKAVKDYSEAQMLKWYNGLHTDCAEYKMWGNGIALPCAVDVLNRVRKAISEH